MPRYLTVPRGAASLVASAKGRAPRSTQPVTHFTSRLAINRGFAPAPCPSFKPAITTQPGVHSFADITRRSRLGFPLCPPAPAPSTRFFNPLPGPIPAPPLFQRSTRLQRSTRCFPQVAASSVHATRSARAPAAAPAPRPASRFLVRRSARDAESVSRSIPARARAPTRAPTPASAPVSRSARLLARHPAPPPAPAPAPVSRSARPLACHPVPRPAPAPAPVSRSARLLARHPVPPPTPVRRCFGRPPVLERMAKHRVAHQQELERLKGLQRVQPSVPSVSVTRSPSPTRSPAVAPSPPVVPSPVVPSPVTRCPPVEAGSLPKPILVQPTQVGGEVKPRKSVRFDRVTVVKVDRWIITALDVFKPTR